MEELLIPGETRGFVVRSRSTARRTRFDLVAVRHGSALVSIDSRIANHVVRAALSAGLLPWARGPLWRSEVGYAGHRFDFAHLDPKDGSVRGLLEVKSSNLRVGHDAWFPDAPTERGRRHLDGLAEAVRRGIRADVVFAVQREDVEGFRANRALDPEFSDALQNARRAGVRVHALTLRVRPGAVALGREIPVR